MSYRDRISVDPNVRSGKPCITGTRITVYDILEYLAGGMSEDDVLRDFQGLAREDIRAALEFAAARERKLAGSAAERNSSSTRTSARGSSNSSLPHFPAAYTSSRPLRRGRSDAEVCEVARATGYVITSI